MQDINQKIDRIVCWQQFVFDERMRGPSKTEQPGRNGRITEFVLSAALYAERPLWADHVLDARGVARGGKRTLTLAHWVWLAFRKLSFNERCCWSNAKGFFFHDRPLAYARKAKGGKTHAELAATTATRLAPTNDGQRRIDKAIHGPSARSGRRDVPQ